MMWHPYMMTISGSPPQVLNINTRICTEGYIIYIIIREGRTRLTFSQLGHYTVGLAGSPSLLDEALYIGMLIS